jgi:hypothetical protein
MLTAYRVAAAYLTEGVYGQPATKAKADKRTARAETVGQAVRESGLPRSELYITSKYQHGEIQLSVRASLYKVRLHALCSYFRELTRQAA